MQPLPCRKFYMAVACMSKINKIQIQPGIWTNLLHRLVFLQNCAPLVPHEKKSKGLIFILSLERTGTFGIMRFYRSQNGMVQNLPTPVLFPAFSSKFLGFFQFLNYSLRSSVLFFLFSFIFSLSQDRLSDAV